jgi:hypothetical protein
VEILGVFLAGVGALEVAGEDRIEITLVADATWVELLEPSSS